jgi:hypothetical protein
MKVFKLVAAALLIGSTVPVNAARESDVSADGKVGASSYLSLSYYFSAQRFTFENVDDYYRDKYKDAKKLTGDQKFDWVVSRHTQARLYYGNCIAELAGCLNDVGTFFQRFREWNHYQRNEFPLGGSYISDDYYNYFLEVEVQRLMARYDAFYLAKPEFSNFVDYEYFADRGKVRFKDGLRTMRFGEVAQKVVIQGKPAVYLMTLMLPNTFVQFNAGEVRWACCIKTCDDIVKENPGKYYFCTWDKQGNPLAVQQLKMPAGTGRTTEWKISVKGRIAELIGFDCRSKKNITLTFSLDERNGNCVEL